MNTGHSILYGVIQGVTEFFPISSSGHLALLPRFIAIEDPGVVFDLMMHLGTAFAVMIFFRKDILFFCKNLKHAYTKNFIITTMVSFISILLIKDVALSYGRTQVLIAINLGAFGILMWGADRWAPQRAHSWEKDFRPWFALLMGVAQTFAIFPGVSRSGITLTTSRALGFSREDSTRYSFLLSLPIILAAALYKAPTVIKGETAFDPVNCAIGIVVSFLVGYLAIKYFLRWVPRGGILYFALYRVVISLLLFF